MKITFVTISAIVLCRAETFSLRGQAHISLDSRNKTAAKNSKVKFVAQQNATSTAERPAKVYFLFLAVDKVSNFGVWKKFFAQATPSQYAAYVHCKLPACKSMVASSGLKLVPTVPSYYCTDLVSPMNQLLAYALSTDGRSTNPLDKFAFISDSTLPAKPFSQIYWSLTSRQGSDFCAFPSDEWADIPSSDGLEVAVKTHQWMVLQRVHAERATLMWLSGKLQNLMGHFQMNKEHYGWKNNSFADNRNFGCLDEFWHMAALYGTLHNVDRAGDNHVSLSLFTNAPLRVASQAGWQGSCDTFVLWSQYLRIGGKNPFSQLYSAMDAASTPHSGNDQRPGWWDTISMQGIRAIRTSEFLFVRKFIDGPHLSGGGNFEAEYSRVVLS